MAGFCVKCGAEVSPDKQFCTACGTPLTAGAAVVAPAQPAAPSASSGSSAVKIVLIIVAIFVGLGILGAGLFGFAVWRVSRAIHVSGPGGQVTMSTPGGTFTANESKTYSASELGVDIYPGALSGKGSMRMSLPNGSWVTAVYLTSDSKDQVIAFYKSRLGSQASVFESADSAVLSVNKGQKESVMVTVTAKPSENNGKTQIAIVHTVNNK
ncbi:MAG: zinc-ribbon domain-containing protein [Terracidiphilus sp.]